jgi:hypothetical protein
MLAMMFWTIISVSMLGSMVVGSRVWATTISPVGSSAAGGASVGAGGSVAAGASVAAAGWVAAATGSSGGCAGPHPATRPEMSNADINSIRYLCLYMVFSFL